MTEQIDLLAAGSGGNCKRGARPAGSMTGQSAGGNAIFRRPGRAPKPGKWLSNNGSAMSFGTRLFTWLHGTYVGSDSAGNRYYRGRPIGARKRERRWVIYAGQPEASKVPAEWHGWLHGTQIEPPTEVKPVHYPWMKPHLPNLTGTASRLSAAGPHAFRRAPRRGDRRLSGLVA